MYSEIGKKIKGLALAIFIIMTIGVAIGGLAMMAIDEELIIIGLLFVGLGTLFAWISTWMLYGFGELIDKVCDIERNTRGGIQTPAAPYGQMNQSYRMPVAPAAPTAPAAPVAPIAPATVDVRRNQIEQLRAQGLITEEEYRQAISKEQ